MNKNLIELEGLLQGHGLAFKELDSRMSYGMIGHLYSNGKMLAMIFDGSFYMEEIRVSINESFLRIIELIRLEFELVSRDNHGTVCPVELGDLSMLVKD